MKQSGYGNSRNKRLNNPEGKVTYSSVTVIELDDIHNPITRPHRFSFVLKFAAKYTRIKLI